MKIINKVFVIFLLTGLVACGSNNREGTQSEEISAEVAEQFPKVNTQKVYLREVDQNYEFTATVEPVVKNNINPNYSGAHSSDFCRSW